MELSDSYPKILIVDDNPIILRNIKSILEKEYAISVATSAKQALTIIDKRVPDLILLDYEMPEVNGKQLMLHLSADDRYNKIPVIFLTATDSKELVLELLALKPAGYLLKPVDINTLKSKIAQVFSHKEH